MFWLMLPILGLLAQSLPKSAFEGSFVSDKKFLSTLEQTKSLL